MKIYFAPMEGITGYIFRNAYDKYYGGIDKYFAPFISPADNCAMNPKEKRDNLPDNNRVKHLVPQILTCKPHHFIDAAKVLSEMGYREINLNLGCPSGTVCAKGKGAGFLSETDELEAFLERIYDYATNNNIKISIKTRIGRYNPEEWYDLVDIYNKFPVYELIVHPRIREDYYKEKPRMSYFYYAMEHSKNPVVYNGDLFSVCDVKRLEKCENIMLGRGLLYNPELPEQLDNIKECKFSDTKCFRQFHDEIYHEYQKIMSPDINVLYRMKELWTYWSRLFPENNREIKKLLKSKHYSEYEIYLNQIL